MEKQQLRHWLALSQVNLSGDRLLSYFEQGNTVADLFGASDSKLVNFGFRAGLAERLSKIDHDKVERDLNWFDDDNKTLIPINSTHYPALLKQTSSAPKLLFAHGNKDLLNSHQIAIVGSRNPTPQGKENAKNFAKALATAGAVITSGLALGVDGIAHQEAVSANLPTIAVAGTGLDRIYPAAHKPLAESILIEGLLISDFALGTGVRSSNFPARNRIISGMSLGTLVIEAALKSGSLITARYAMEQSREVFAIPGSIHNPLAKGCHYLIKQGAKLVETAEEIIEELQALAKWQIEQNQQQETTSQFALDEDYQQLLAQIDYDVTHINTIISRTGLEIEVVSHMLLLLELNNYIKSMAGGYQRIA